MKRSNRTILMKFEAHVKQRWNNNIARLNNFH